MRILFSILRVWSNPPPPLSPASDCFSYESTHPKICEPPVVSSCERSRSLHVHRLLGSASYIGAALFQLVTSIPTLRLGARSLPDTEKEQVKGATSSAGILRFGKDTDIVSHP